MNDEFSNRLTSFDTALGFANKDENTPVWENRVPKAFGTKLQEAAGALAALKIWTQKQSASIAGAAEAKDKEQTDLENAAFEMAQAVVTYFMDKGRLADAEPFRRAVTWWQGLRDQDLLANSQSLLDAATPVTIGPDATAAADGYGISAARVAALKKERDDYNDLVTSPAEARAGRKALTQLMRGQFQPAMGKFRDLDRLVVQFKTQPNGEAFVAGWFASRQVVDSGHGPGTPPAAPTAK